MNTRLRAGAARIDDLQSRCRQGELRGETKLVKITEDVRKYAGEHSLTNEEAIESGMQEKRKNLREVAQKFTRRRSCHAKSLP